MHPLVKAAGAVAAAVATIQENIGRLPRAKRVGLPTRPNVRKRKFLWLHPTKGWKGAVSKSKRGRPRPVPYAQRQLDNGLKVKVQS